jgi:uncharacterized protein
LGTEYIPEFDWDEANVRHIARHGIQPQEIEFVIRNDPADVGYDMISGEDRWTVVGHTDQMRILIVVFTMRGKLFRPVTARNASRRRRVEYLRSKGLNQ